MQCAVIFTPVKGKLSDSSGSPWIDFNERTFLKTQTNVEFWKSDLDIVALR